MAGRERTVDRFDSTAWRGLYLHVSLSCFAVWFRGEVIEVLTWTWIAPNCDRQGTLRAVFCA